MTNDPTPWADLLDKLATGSASARQGSLLLPVGIAKQAFPAAQLGPNLGARIGEHLPEDALPELL